MGRMGGRWRGWDLDLGSGTWDLDILLMKR